MSGNENGKFNLVGRVYRERRLDNQPTNTLKHVSYESNVAAQMLEIYEERKK
jgi:hypothetical protein